ncbi:two-component system, NtrC family, response regulator PilR [Mariprofundus micogutta]|uniref:Two-component system, NtrC family, response regulator PilR n=1 Tax=Mariprofundus micogutta TaxID=1921010 RepID=A0A1L8CPL3_9PROT|nr:sigma-54 dependent transcriptional regulator [Mariprofundus micogutta]GAV20865.1 two-component system, NtrC family, response regulator PilR [Mariprofundus micogutta]
MAEILLVEDEANARKILSLGLELQGHQVVACASPEDAEQRMKEKSFDVVLTDLRMQGRDAGLEVIKTSQQLQPQARVLLLTAYASAETAVTAMKEGAFDYLTKPVSGEELAAAVERALFNAASSSEHKAEVMPERSEDKEMLIGESELMQRVRQRLGRAAKSDFTVLITGESGTGKELAARFVHAYSARSKAMFVPVHCAAIPEGLFESELFGHRKGSFTGADFDRVGLIESADGGTLFLDEVGEMPLSVQVKLLRVLQERRIRRVGDDRERDVNVRIIAATNRDLDTEVSQGHFREDLFFRLNVVPVHLPPLRQRREDIPQLAQAIVRQWSEGRARISEACMKRLCELPFMGNVRELENILQRMLALSETGDLDLQLLSELYSTAHSEPQLSLSSLQQDEHGLDEWMEGIEKQVIDEALAKTGGNITRAAEELGISFRSLRYRLKKLGFSGDDT